MTAPSAERPEVGDDVVDARDGALARVVASVRFPTARLDVVEVRYLSSGRRTTMTLPTFRRRFRPV